MLVAAQPETPPWVIGAAVVGGLLMGALCGLMPLRAAASKSRPGLGMAGFFTCLVSGLGFGCLLALPVALLFTLVIKILPHAATLLPDVQTESFNPYAGGKTSAF